MRKKFIYATTLSILMLGLVVPHAHAEEVVPAPANAPEVETESTDTRTPPRETGRPETRPNAPAERGENRATPPNERPAGREVRDAQPAGERAETREIRQEARQDLRTERREALNEIRQERVRNLAANLSNRLEAASARLFQIIDRTESRLIKLQAAGADIGNAQASLRRASASLTEARSLMADIDREVNAATTSNTPLQTWRPLKERYAKVAGLIRQASRELREAVAHAKSAVADLETSRGVSEAVRANNGEPSLSE